MKKLISILLLSVVLVTSCGDDDDGGMGPCIEPGNTIVTDDRPVDGFEQISMEGIGTLLITQGSPTSLQVRTHTELLDVIETTVVNEELRLSIDGCIEGEIDQLEYVITTPDLTRLSIAGVGNIEGQNDLDLDALEIITSGVGNVDLSGTVGTLVIVSSGASNVQTFDLASMTCSVTISGAGTAQVTVTDELVVTISGSGSVFYKGSPSITTNISGAGSLVDAN